MARERNSLASCSARDVCAVSGNGATDLNAAAELVAINKHDMPNTARRIAPAQPLAPVTASPAPSRLRLSDARGELKLRIASAWVAARRRARLSQSDVAADLDLDKATVGRLEAAGCKESPSAAVVASAAFSRVSREIGLAVVHELNDAYELVGLERAAVKHETHAARMAAVAVETSDPLRVYAASLADGEQSDAELRDIIVEARQAIATLMELEASAAVELAKRRGEA